MGVRVGTSTKMGETCWGYESGSAGLGLGGGGRGYHMIAYGVSVEGEVICIDHSKGGEILLEAGKEELSEGNNRPSVVHYPRLRQPHPYESEAREKAGQTQERFPSLPEAQRATRGYGK